MNKEGNMFRIWFLVLLVLKLSVGRERLYGDSAPLRYPWNKSPWMENDGTFTESISSHRFRLGRKPSLGEKPFQNARARRTETVTAYNEPATEVSTLPTDPGSNIEVVRFGADCSAHNVDAMKGEDMVLKCEMWLPLGSSLIWYSNGAPEIIHKHYVPANNSKELIGRHEQEFHLMAAYYIDCVNLSDEGKYSLEVVTPNNQSFKREFTIRVNRLFQMSFYCCTVCRQYRDYSPRIVEFAKTAVGRAGTSLYLPCRKEGQIGIVVSWDRQDRDLGSGNYNITADGDLKIENLSNEDNGFFSCRISSKVFDSEFTVSTFVKVLM